MSKNNESKNNSKNYISRITLTQCICMIIILLSIFTVKYFFKGTYNELKEWYKENICIDTDINEVLIPDGDIDET